MDESRVQTTLKKLEQYRNSQVPILSVYLGVVSKKAPSNRFLASLFHSLVHQNLSSEEQKLFKKDLDKIDSYLQESFNTRGERSIVFFSSRERLFEVLTFEFYLPPLCVIAYSPYTRPIEEAFDSYKKYLVVLADRKKARIFTVYLGKIQEHKDVFDGFVPQIVKQINESWKREDKILRHIQDHLHRHLRMIVQQTSDFVREHPVNFIILGGHKEFIPKVRKHLSKPLARMVLGEFVTELSIPLNTVFLNSKKIAEKIEQDTILKRLEVSLQ